MSRCYISHSASQEMSYQKSVIFQFFLQSQKISFLEELPRATRSMRWRLSVRKLLTAASTRTITHWCRYVCVLVIQLGPTLCNPMDSSLLVFSIHGILQARMLEWIAISFSQGIFSAQGLNQTLPHCRQVLYCLSQQGSLLL